MQAALLAWDMLQHTALTFCCRFVLSGSIRQNSSMASPPARQAWMHAKDFQGSAVASDSPGSGGGSGSGHAPGFRVQNSASLPSVGGGKTAPDAGAI